jgi:hypothetical protein
MNRRYRSNLPVREDLECAHALNSAWNTRRIGSDIIYVARGRTPEQDYNGLGNRRRSSDTNKRGIMLSGDLRIENLRNKRADKV